MEKKTVSTSPEKPGAIQTVELLQRRWLTRNAFEIELTRPPSFEFKPGQTIRFIHESLERYYSLLSTPDDSNLVICVSHVPPGHFFPAPRQCRARYPIKIVGPTRIFHLQIFQQKAGFYSHGYRDCAIRFLCAFRYN